MFSQNENILTSVFQLLQLWAPTSSWHIF